MGIALVIEWIEKGKQVGSRYEFHGKDGLMYADIAIQKHKGAYVVYMSEILESKFAKPEDDLVEVIYKFDHISDAINMIEAKGAVGFQDLRPQKGSKIFDPNGMGWDQVADD